MARLCELIEAFLKDLMDNSDDFIEIQRNELANRFKCVPSQINYVIETRFTNERGYCVESRRGGGGHIKIRKVNINASGNYLMHIITSIGSSITKQEADVFITNFIDYEIITLREGILIKSALMDKALINVSIEKRDETRANILKSILINLAVV